MDLIPVILWTSTLGIVAGCGSMLIYRWLSPQTRLAAVSENVATARKHLQTFDGTDIGQLGALIREAVGASLEQLRLILPPTVIAIVPVLALAWCLEGAQQFITQPVPVPGLRWLSVGHLAFWMPLSISALILKSRLKIR